MGSASTGCVNEIQAFFWLPTDEANEWINWPTDKMIKGFKSSEVVEPHILIYYIYTRESRHVLKLSEKKII